jgi:hypothetical protein
MFSLIVLLFQIRPAAGPLVGDFAWITRNLNISTSRRVAGRHLFVAERRIYFRSKELEIHCQPPPRPSLAN